MFLRLFILIALFIFSFFFSSAASGFLGVKFKISAQKKTSWQNFCMYFIYFFMATCAVVCFTPQLYDQVTPVSVLKIFIPFMTALCVYLCLLFNKKILFRLSILFLPVLSAFIVISDNCLLFQGVLNKHIETLIIGLIVSLVAFSCTFLATFKKVPEIFLSFVMLGIFGIYFAGGLPYYAVLLASIFLGSFVSLSTLEIQDLDISLDKNARIAMLFLCANLFLLTGVNEFSAVSVALLFVYPVIEMIFALILTYIFRKKTMDLVDNTVIATVKEKGMNETDIYIMLFQTECAGILMSVLQLFSFNLYTVPILAFLAEGWILSKFYKFDEPQKTFKEANKEFVENIKQSINNFKKDR